MAANWLFIGSIHANLTENSNIAIEYLKSMYEKIKTSNKIFIKGVKKIIYDSIEYSKANVTVHPKRKFNKSLKA